MSTKIRATVSNKNPYYISKHRYYELKHFCLQYTEFQKKYNELCKDIYSGTIKVTVDDSKKYYGNEQIWIRQRYLDSIELIENTAYDSDDILGEYVFLSVTQDRSYNWLRMNLNIPCGKDMFYKAVRRFYWLLDSRKIQTFL